MFYKWPAKYGGMDASIDEPVMVQKDENRRLKRVFAVTCSPEVPSL